MLGCFFSLKRLEQRLISGGFSSAQSFIYTSQKTHKHTLSEKQTVYTFTVVEHGLLNMKYGDIYAAGSFVCVCALTLYHHSRAHWQRRGRAVRERARFC